MDDSPTDTIDGAHDVDNGARRIITESYLSDPEVPRLKTLVC
jgi:hypothetical protein